MCKLCIGRNWDTLCSNLDCNSDPSLVCSSPFGFLGLREIGNIHMHCFLRFHTTRLALRNPTDVSMRFYFCETHYSDFALSTTYCVRLFGKPRHPDCCRPLKHCTFPHRTKLYSHMSSRRRCRIFKQRVDTCSWEEQAHDHRGTAVLPETTSKDEDSYTHRTTPHSLFIHTLVTQRFTPLAFGC